MLGVERTADDFILTKSKDVKTGTNLAEILREGYGSNVVLPIMMMIYNS
jgi:hypothetical protein